MKSVNYLSFISMTVLGMVGSILVGFIFFNKLIFEISLTTFQFVELGLFGALFFSLLEYGSIKNQIVGIAAILFITLSISITKKLSFALVIRDTLSLGSLFLSVKLYFQLIVKNNQLKYYIRSIALGLFYGITNIIFISIVYLINSKAGGFPPLSFIYIIARYGILIGIGIGLGIDFYLHKGIQIFNFFKIKNT